MIERYVVATTCRTPLVHIGSHAKTSDDRCRACMLGRKAGMTSLAMVCGVQPSEQCMERMGRMVLKRNISFLRTPNICPVTSLALLEQRNTTMGAILAADMLFSRSSRIRSTSLCGGMVSIMRLHAK